MTERLRGQDYRARRRIADVDNVTLVEVGDTCEKVPATALAALLASGKIERALERRTTERPPAAKKRERR
jgi:hypothetical protein